jgi:hypothetical protein
VTNQKKQLTLNTDWHTAAGMLGLTIFSIFLAVSSSWEVLVGKTSDFQPSWQTAVSVTVLIAAFILIPDRMARFVIGLLLFQPVIEIIGWSLHFSSGARGMNLSIARCANVAACLIVFIYGIQWFREHTTYT